MEKLEQIAENAAKAVGTALSILIHTVIFIIAFLCVFLGVSFSQILLFLTTIVSLEAIYLSLFVQMTVNKHSRSIKDIHTHLKKDEVAIAKNKSRIRKSS